MWVYFVYLNKSILVFYKTMESRFFVFTWLSLFGVVIGLFSGWPPVEIESGSFGEFYAVHNSSCERESWSFGTQIPYHSLDGGGCWWQVFLVFNLFLRSSISQTHWFWLGHTVCGLFVVYYFHLCSVMY